MRRGKLQAKWFLSVLCGVLFFLTSAFFPKSGALLERVSAEAEMKDSGLNYAECTENIVNPERGFYQALGRSIPAEGREAWWSEETFAAYTRSFGIIHLRLGLESFSSAAVGKDSPVSEDALAALSATLDALRQAGGTAIVRFSYNYEGKTVDGRYVDWEPAPELIETHIAQLGGVLARNTDVVAAVETGMLGPWGEQHSTALATSGEEIFYRIVEAWLRAIPSNRTVSVRRPLYYTYWANRKYGTNLTPENLSGDIAEPGTDAGRVGVFNDGYLGSDSDLGTFADRTEETEWLFSRARQTLYGGEVVADSETGLLGAYNDVDYLEKEAFLTHTSYLNISWNDRVINAWKNTPYDGADPVYAGFSDYDYVAAHLGYRLVLRKSELSSSASGGGVLRLRGSIENVGFGNVVNQRLAEILLIGEKERYVCSVDWDVRTVASASVAGYDWSFRLPSDIPEGNYRVFLRLRGADEKSVSALRCLKLANAGIFDEESGGNFLGSIRVEGVQETGRDTFEQIGGGETACLLSFVSEKGTEGMSKDISASLDSVVRLPDEVPERLGYDFAGWSDGKKVYAAGAEYVLCGNSVLAAVWTKAPCTVIFDGGGGTLQSGKEMQQVLCGEAAVPPVYERTGYTFCGWSADPSRIEGNITIVALWKANTYTVRFLSREEAELTEGEATQEVVYGGAAIPPVYVREGYRLIGWSGDYNEIADHCVFYAVWEKIPAEEGCGSNFSCVCIVLMAGLSAALLFAGRKNFRK